MVWAQRLQGGGSGERSILFSRFVGLSLEDKCSYNSVISRFYTELTEKNGYEKVFTAVNKQFEKYQIIVKTGAIIDACIILIARENLRVKASTMWW